MRINSEEKLMYEVMQAIYESRIPISFKGSMVLKACLSEAGYTEDTRHTVDIDANWNTEVQPTAEQMTESLQRALDEKGIDLQVSLYRMYGEGKSAGFDLINRKTSKVPFTMDMDVNRPPVPTHIYEVEGIRFKGVLPVQMAADKLLVVSTNKVFRRIKDVIDLYYLSKVVTFDPTEISETLENNGKKIGAFKEFYEDVDQLKHVYEKFRLVGDVAKPEFNDIYETVKKYIEELVPQQNKQENEFKK